MTLFYNKTGFPFFPSRAIFEARYSVRRKIRSPLHFTNDLKWPSWGLFDSKNVKFFVLVVVTQHENLRPWSMRFFRTNGIRLTVWKQKLVGTYIAALAVSWAVISLNNINIDLKEEERL